MSDSYEEVSHVGYVGRLGGAIKGILLGVILFAASFAVLFWNEGRAVKRTRALNDTAANLVAVDAASISATNDGRPVHFSGRASGEQLADPKFNVSREAIHLHRVAEMYQWDQDEKRETRRRAGGGKTTTTTYTYKKVWKDHPIDSTRFKHPTGHENPLTMRVRGEKWVAGKVDVGAYRLSPSLVDKIDSFAQIPADEEMLAGLPSAARRELVLSGGQFYLSNSPNFRTKVDPGNPQVGDIRVSFKAVPPGPVSVVARQTGGTVDAFQTASGPVQMLYVGTHTADAMFKSEHDKNNFLTWVLRVVGFAAMWIGLALALNPLRVLADVVGILGDLAGAGIGLVSGLVALVLSLATIAVAWLFYRPVLGGGLLAVAAVGVWGFTRLRKTGHERFEQQRHHPAPAGVIPPPPLPLPPVPNAPSQAA